MEPSIQKSLISEEKPYTYYNIHGFHSFLYVISKLWWDSWCAYTGFQCKVTGENPGIIDNSSIDFDSPDPTNYMYLTRLIWKRFQNWYGGGPKIKVFIINGVPDFKTIIVKLTNNNKTKKIRVPLRLSLYDFKEYASKKLRSNVKNLKFFIDSETGKKIIKNSMETLEENGFFNKIKIIAVGIAVNFHSVAPLEIKEEFDEDEDLQKALSNSLNDNVLFDEASIRGDMMHMEDDKIVNIGEQDFDEFKIKKNSLTTVKQEAAEAFTKNNIKLKLHSLNDIKKNLTQIYQKFNN